MYQTSVWALMMRMWTMELSSLPSGQLFAVWQERQTEQIMTKCPLSCWCDVLRERVTGNVDLAWGGISKAFWGRRHLRQSESRVAVGRRRTGVRVSDGGNSVLEGRKKRCLLKTKQQQPQQSGRRPEGWIRVSGWKRDVKWDQKKPPRTRSQGPQRAE